MRVYIDTDEIKENWIPIGIILSVALLYLGCAIWMFWNEQSVAWYFCWGVFLMESFRIFKILYTGLIEKEEDEKENISSCSQCQGEAETPY